MIYDNFVRFGQVYVSVALYIYSIEEPGAVGDTGSGAGAFADPIPPSSPSLPLLLFQRGRGVGGVGGMYGYSAVVTPCPLA